MHPCDITEGEEKNGGCMHDCEKIGNTLQYQCKCQKDYKLEGDGHTCVKSKGFVVNEFSNSIFSLGIGNWISWDL